MAGRDGLKFGGLGLKAAHLCVDAQRMFAEETDWHTPWLARILPNLERITAAHPQRTVFTRFVCPASPGEAAGAWRRYYEHWPSMTLNALGPEMVDLLPSLSRFVPPARVVDKRVYSPWMEPELEQVLRAEAIDTLVVTGGETDVCVLASILGAVDRGYRVIVACDAVCSSADQTYDAMMFLYQSRFGEQIETAPTAEILDAWPS
ncbi:cysteine hydrolase [Methylorubrum populi]|uniref:Cysteine hydrolase n=1 Tax=Methylobacterium radiotolerans TaxID=31998 RepID=A0ABU7T4R5_9HYPH|nr:cysteine hydrolase [Methylobacterium sp. B4]PXW50880.1 nicotinamidase-related amidase [Methylobacterium sp. B4]